MSKCELLAAGLDLSGGNRLLTATRGWNGLLVLNYHRIGQPDDSGFDDGLWSATAESFEQQVRHLANGFDVVTVRDLPDIWQRRSGRYVMITFDDGYRDNFEAAFDVLCAFRLPAVFFVCPGFLDSPHVPWWDEISWMIHRSPLDRLPAVGLLSTPYPLSDAADRNAAVQACLKQYKSLPVDQATRFRDELAEATGSGRCPAKFADDLWMTWDMVRQMQRQGMEIGGHTLTHPVLSQCRRERQRAEILGCQQRLRDELGRPANGFSYPVGGRDRFTETTESLVAEAGFQWAFTYHGGFQRQCPSNPFQIPRVAIEMTTTPAMFRSLVTLPQVFA